MLEYSILCVAALFAGLVDAVVGGGGLIQLPALFAAFPGTAPATLFGTSKFAGVFGTGAAAINYAKLVKVEWGAAIPAAMAAFVFAFLGAFAVTHLPGDYLRKLLPFILVVVALYTFHKKDLGKLHAPKHTGSRERITAIAVGMSIGFYDGFFGPGTGSVLVFLFVRFFGFDFLSASAVAKVVNVACNLAALLWFGYSGHVMWQLGALMAVSNIAGSLIGSRLAIRNGSEFVRKVFLVVVLALIGKTGWDAFIR